MILTETKLPYYLVIGLGKSGLSMAKFLSSKGKRVIATDIDAGRSELNEQLNEIGIDTQIGYHEPETFNNAAFLVPSPGIPLDNTFIQNGLKKGAVLTCELDIFSEYNTLPIIAITGTNGKTTTTTLIGELLRSSGFNPFVGGNIGTPLVDLLMSEEKFNFVVAEISSFQLDMASNFTPDIGVLLNISQDHLDRYDSYEAYEKSKWSLFKNQTSKNTAVINKAISSFEEQSKAIEAKIDTFSSKEQDKDNCTALVEKENILFSLGESQSFILKGIFKELSGIHNRENIAAAYLACRAAGADYSKLNIGLNAFKNLSHRIEFIKTIDGVDFYNDSKATNTDAVIRALQTFEKNIILILGGREKDTDFSLLIKDIEQSVKAVIAIGESKTRIKKLLNPICTTTSVKTMNEAVKTAFVQAVPGDVVLLSPACASFDMYSSYNERGQDFILAVNDIDNRTMRDH